MRVGASEGLQRLCKVCGADWLQEKVLPRIHNFYEESTFYLIRIAILNALKKLANGEVREILRCWLSDEARDVVFLTPQELAGTPSPDRLMCFPHFGIFLPEDLFIVPTSRSLPTLPHSGECGERPGRGCASIGSERGA